MAAVFLKLLNLSISASWLVLAVLVLRLISKRSPKWMNVLLWGIVALRLMLPFSIESALSLIPSAETVSPAAVQFAPAPTITSGVSVIDNAVNPSLSEHFAAVPTASVNPLYVWTEIAGWVWLIGLGAMLLYALVSYLRLRRRVSVSLPIQDCIYLCDAISSPFILGVVKPHIYLPSGLDEVQRQNVLSHERAHLARRDHWWKPLGFALLAVYWFNPVLWLAYTLLCRDIELACDERVIRTMDESAVKTYSTVLLACSIPRKAVITCPLAFGEVGVKERVKNALHYKKPAFWVVAASVAVCVVVAVCFLTNPEHETMKWAKNLRVDDVVRIELIVMSRTVDKQYMDLDAEEFAEIVTLINKSIGRYQKETELPNDRTFSLYITTTDGVRHEVVNDANVYLRIDGDSYRLTQTWRPRTTGNAPIPEGFWTGDKQGSDEIDDPRGNASTLLTAVDLDEDGMEEEIFFEEVEPGQIYRIYAESNGSERWSAELGLAHVGWDSYFLYRNGDTSAILRYNPAMFQGFCDYEYELFTIGADGRNLLAQRSVEFDANPDSNNPWPPDAQIFADEVNALLEKSTLLISTLDGELHLEDGTTFRCVPRGDAASATGYAAYDALLAEISDLRRSGASEAQTDFSHDLLSVNDYYQTPGWLLRNLDGDGIPELLLGADWGDGYGVIFNIYRLDGAKAVRVVDGWSRSRWYLCTDGSLANEGSSSAFESSYSYYRYTSGELQHLETLLYLDGGSGGSPWRYSATADHYVSSGDFRSVTEAEATAVRDKYTHETLILTPFVV